MADLDVLKALPQLEFRGIKLPLLSRSVNFEHINVSHKYAFRDGELFDGLGRRNWKFSYTIPFRQGIAKGPYSNLYSETFPLFIEAFKDRSEGKLLDPVLGEFQVRPGSMSISTDIGRRDGEDVSVDFVHSPKPNEKDTTKTASLAGVAASAAKLNEEVTKQQLGFDLDAFLTDLSRFKGQFATFGSQITSQLSRVSRTLQEFEDDITDPSQWPLQQSSRQIRMAIEDLKNKALSPGKEVLRLTTTGPKTMAAIATMTGMSTEELLTLNPLLPSYGPMIPGGTTVSYWKNS